jgi:hypothetical protein
MDLQNVKKGAFWAARPRQYKVKTTKRKAAAIRLEEDKKRAR